MYVATLNITDVKRQQALLLYQIREATLFIFDTLSDTGDDYHTAMTKLDEYYSPKKNVDFETWFRTSTQKTGETIDQYATRFQTLAQNCEFPDVNHELKSTIIQNCSSKLLWQISLQDDLTLDALLAKARLVVNLKPELRRILCLFEQGTNTEKYQRQVRRNHHVLRYLHWGEC